MFVYLSKQEYKFKMSICCRRTRRNTSWTSPPSGWILTTSCGTGTSSSFQQQSL